MKRIKNQDTLAQIGCETLNGLCKYLNCTPADLIEYVADQKDKAE